MLALNIAGLEFVLSLRAVESEPSQLVRNQLSKKCRRADVFYLTNQNGAVKSLDFSPCLVMLEPNSNPTNFSVSCFEYSPVGRFCTVLNSSHSNATGRILTVAFL